MLGLDQFSQTAITPRKLADADANQRADAFAIGQMASRSIFLITLLLVHRPMQVDMVLRLWSRDHVDMTMDGRFQHPLDSLLALRFCVPAPAHCGGISFAAERKRHRATGRRYVGIAATLTILQILPLSVAVPGGPEQSVDVKACSNRLVVAAHLGSATRCSAAAGLVHCGAIQPTGLDSVRSLVSEWWCMDILRGKVAAWSIALPSQYIHGDLRDHRREPLIAARTLSILRPALQVSAGCELDEHQSDSWIGLRHVWRSIHRGVVATLMLP